MRRWEQRGQPGRGARRIIVSEDVVLAGLPGVARPAGRFPGAAGARGHEFRGQACPAQAGPAPSDSARQAAQQACQSLLPATGGQRFSGTKVTSCFGGPHHGCGPPASGYGVIVVANASVRLLVLPLFVCTKNDLNVVPSSARPW